MGGGRWRLARAAAAQGRLLFWKVHLFLPLQGVGWGNAGKCGPLVCGYSVIRTGWVWGGGRSTEGGGGCPGDGGEGMCCERAGFESAGARSSAGGGQGREGAGGYSCELQLVGVLSECMRCVFDILNFLMVA